MSAPLVAGAALGALLLLGKDASAAEKRLARIVKSRHGDAVVDFTIDDVPIGPKRHRFDVKETPDELAKEATRKLGRKISPAVIMIASLMESEAGDQPDLARVAIAHAAITYAQERYGNKDLTRSLRKLLLPAWHAHKIVIDGHMGSQQGGRYASTRKPPTERDVELAEAVLADKIRNPVPGAIKWDSPRAQDELYRAGVYDKDSDDIAKTREHHGLVAAYLPGIDHDELRLWRAAA